MTVKVFTHLMIERKEKQMKGRGEREYLYQLFAYPGSASGSHLCAVVGHLGTAGFFTVAGLHKILYSGVSNRTS
jgi:hypothetical protein